MEPLDALAAALSGWRKTRHPRFAALADWATTRALGPGGRPLVGAGGKKSDVEAWLALYEARDVLDVPRLLAAVGGGKSPTAAERVKLLGKLDDPRVVSGLLALLGAPPYRAKTALPFFRACAEVLAAAKDPRVRPALEDLAQRYKGVLETSVGDLVAALLRRTAEELDQVKPGPLPAPLEKQCAALEALFETERGATRRVESTTKSARQSDDALLAAIYAAPDDDGPRLVFADTLTERGDERGELISIQLARARGAATSAQLFRERELLRDAKRRSAWALPLSQGGDCHLARGFPDALQLDPRTIKQVLDEPALRLLHTLTGLERDKLALKTAKALLQGPHLANLTTVKSFDRPLFEALDGPLPWVEAGLRFFPRADELARFPKLRRLTLSPENWEARLDPRAFTGAPLLEWLSLGTGPQLPTPEHLAPLTALTHLELDRGDESLRAALGALPRLRSLRLLRFGPAGSLKDLPLERLACRWEVDLDVAALVGGLPKLRELELQAPTAQPRAVQQLFVDAAVQALETVTLGPFTFRRPFRADGALVVRIGNRMDQELERLGEALLSVPPGCVQRVVVRPQSEDPNQYLAEPLNERQLQLLSRGKPPAPLSVEWW